MNLSIQHQMILEMEVLQNKTTTSKYYQNAKRILDGLGGYY